MVSLDSQTVAAISGNAFARKPPCARHLYVQGLQDCAVAGTCQRCELTLSRLHRPKTEKSSLAYSFNLCREVRSIHRLDAFAVSVGR